MNEEYGKLKSDAEKASASAHDATKSAFSNTGIGAGVSEIKSHEEANLKHENAINAHLEAIDKAGSKKARLYHSREIAKHEKAQFKHQNFLDHGLDESKDYSIEDVTPEQLKERFEMATLPVPPTPTNPAAATVNATEKPSTDAVDNGVAAVKPTSLPTPSPEAKAENPSANLPVNSNNEPKQTSLPPTNKPDLIGKVYEKLAGMTPESIEQLLKNIQDSEPKQTHLPTPNKIGESVEFQVQPITEGKNDARYSRLREKADKASMAANDATAGRGDYEWDNVKEALTNPLFHDDAEQAHTIASMAHRKAMKATDSAVNKDYHKTAIEHHEKKIKYHNKNLGDVIDESVVTPDLSALLKEAGLNEEFAAQATKLFNEAVEKKVKTLSEAFGDSEYDKETKHIGSLADQASSLAHKHNTRALHQLAADLHDHALMRSAASETDEENSFAHQHNGKAQEHRKISSSLKEEVEVPVSDALVEQVDQYLTGAVLEWIEQNKVAVDSGLRQEIAEDFIGKLGAFLSESYVDFQKIDLTEQAKKDLEAAQKTITESAEALKKVTDQVNSLLREKILNEAREGLVLTDRARLDTLVEKVEFTSEDDFKSKIQTIREQAFPSKKATAKQPEIVTHLTEDDKQVELSESMKRYSNTLSRVAKS